VAPLAYAAGVGQREQQTQGFAIHALLGIVQVPAGALGGEALAARRLGVEQLAQGDVRARARVRLERPPFGARDERTWRGCVQASIPRALSSIRCSSWFQDLVKDAPPSSCSRAASASRSTPASA